MGEAASPSQGLPFEKVMIEGVVLEENYAMVRNEFGRQRQIPLFMRSRGPRPVEGETWLISRDTGYWTFALCILPKPPTITGDAEGNVALAQLLAWLDQTGLIVDGST